MITSKELNELGLPNHKQIMPLAMKLINQALSGGACPVLMRENLNRLCQQPAGMAEDPVLGELAHSLHRHFPDGVMFTPRANPAPWRQWGELYVEDSALQQMENACSLPKAVRGALMPDAHTGYGLPIGGVLATEGIVIPYAVGVDIACRMRLSVLDLPPHFLNERREALIAALEQETRFGVGAEFAPAERREHAVMDEDWNVTEITGRSKGKAWKQLGSSGGGNHFVEFGELHLESTAELGGRQVEQGVYLALLSHSGSRGSGQNVAEHYSKLAMSMRPALPSGIRHLAWLDLDSEAGQEYWAAMELMGRYAAANHEQIHAHILRKLGAEALSHVENHHNFAWKEKYEGKNVIIHRKGATPAAAGVQGIIPGSMASPAFVVSGKGNKEALNSCSHGAGRLMSRTMAFNSPDANKLQACLQEQGVELLSGGLDEAPMAYKDIFAVIAAQDELVDVLARFDPRLVKMAPPDKQLSRRKRKVK